MTTLEPGMPAPEFTLTDQHGNEVSLHDYRGGKVIVWFYPQAQTPACRAQTCDFRDHLRALTDAGYSVLGISRDSVEKLLRASDADNVSYPLLSDPEHDVHEAYGAWGEKNSYGRIVTGVKRSTFVIDEQGAIERTFYNTKAKGHLSMLTKQLGLAS